ncbi:MAG: ABC transporter ATP-binding protein, partial [Pirellulales bacterium]
MNEAEVTRSRDGGLLSPVGAASGKERSAMRLAWKFLARQRRAFAVALMWRTLFVLAPMQLPILTGAIVDGLTGQRVEVYGWIVRGPAVPGVPPVVLLGLPLVALLVGLGAYGQMLASHTLSRAFVSDLRKAVMRKALQMEFVHVQRWGTGDLLDRMLTDTANLRRFMERVCVQSLVNVLRVVYPIAMLMLIDLRMTLFAVTVLPAQVMVTRRLQRKLHAATRTSRRSHSGLTTTVKETLDAIETIKVLGAESPTLARIHQGTDQVECDELIASHYSSAISGTVFLMTSLGIALTWWQGGGQVLAGTMTLGTLVRFTGFVMFAYQPFRQFTTILSTYRPGLVSLERIGQLLDAPLPTVRPSIRPFRIRDGAIAINNVTFGYGARPVLSRINLRIEPYQLTVITGPSGSGKSSLLRIIARLHDPDEGDVLIDGTNLRSIDVTSLRARVAVVPQQPAILSGTVMENVCLACPDAEPCEVEAACRAAGAHAFIEQLDAGYQTQLGCGGVHLSGGQAQRIAMARALLRRPAILLLDEPTSALDAASERDIVDVLRQIRCETTVVVVGHRRATIRAADRIVRMEDGRVIENSGQPVSRCRDFVQDSRDAKTTRG